MSAIQGSCATFRGRRTRRDDRNRVRAFYPELEFTTDSYAMSIPGSPTAMSSRRELLQHDDAAGSLPISGTADRADHANHGVPVTVGASEMPIPLHFAFLEGTMSSGRRKPVAAVAGHFDVPDLDATKTTSPMATSSRWPASRSRWRRLPRSGSTIPCTGFPITPRRARRISRTSCCSPTTSSTSTNSASMRATSWQGAKADIPPSSSPAIS